MGGNIHIRVPLDICDVRIFLHNAVNHAYDEVLHLWIGEVEHELCASAAGHQVPVLSLEHPVGMLLVKLTLGIDHFRLYPDSELDSVLFGRLHESPYSIRQLHLVHLPVAQGRVVGESTVLLSEPAVVHHEELAAH